jgi:hypothetical protein
MVLLLAGIAACIWHFFFSKKSAPHERAAPKMIDSVGILPWLDIRTNIEVGPVTFYRADGVDTLLGERADILIDRLRIYRDAWEGNPVHGAVAIHRDQLANGGHIPYGDLRRATDILMIASIFENDGVLRDCNATTFTLYIQRLGGEGGFMATRARRRNGGFVSGGTTDLVVSRPISAATFWTYNRAILAALVAASQRADDQAWNLFESITWFRRASTDADNIEQVVDFVLLLTAVDHLIAHPATGGAGMDWPRIQALLANFRTIPCCSVKPKDTVLERCQIEAVLYVLNETRNTAVHPRTLKRALEFEFNRRKDPTFAWVVDRSYMALLVARLIELGNLQADDFMRAFVQGIERWIHDPAKEVGLMVLEEKMQIGIRDYVADAYATEVTQVPRDAEPDAIRIDWDRNFRLALGLVAAPFEVHLVWLADGHGVIEIHDPTRLNQLVDYWLVDPADDEPARMAYASMAYFQSEDGTGGLEKTWNEADLRAMQDPRLWIDGDSLPG